MPPSPTSLQPALAIPPPLPAEPDADAAADAPVEASNAARSALSLTRCASELPSGFLKRAQAGKKWMPKPLRGLVALALMPEPCHSRPWWMEQPPDRTCTVVTTGPAALPSRLLSLPPSTFRELCWAEEEGVVPCRSCAPSLWFASWTSRCLRKASRMSQRWSFTLAAKNCLVPPWCPPPPSLSSSSSSSHLCEPFAYCSGPTSSSMLSSATHTVTTWLEGVVSKYALSR
mmetsp:Transcript_54390/g.93722  ORF Transcript_54390/g.93722 Transcript_54390/m.93722 type:complete len:230 (-) Transcript_54390:552-1241(-)